MANIKFTSKSIKKVARLLRTVGQPSRLKIMLAIGEGEVCVCHLESLLGMRQAYISQHLMALRQANLVEDRRDGRYIYYRVSNPGMLALIRQAAELTGLSGDDITALSPPKASPDCPCPHCEGDFIPVGRVS
jgi:DNA-binding transcriptional ArsR family regulator